MPAVDFSTKDEDFTLDQIRECKRIIEGLKRANAKVMRLGGSLEALSTVAEKVEQLEKELDAVTETRAMETFPFLFDSADPNNILPFNPGTGEFNPMSPKIKVWIEGGKVLANCEFSNCFEGGPDTVHGGLVGTVFDQLLAYGVMAKGKTGPTLWLKTSYLKPTPINKVLRFEVFVESIDEKKYTVKGACFDGELKLAEAEALMLAAIDLPQK